MALPTIDTTTVTTTTNTAKKPEAEEDPFEGWEDEFSAYLEAVDAERGAKKVCLRFLFESSEGVRNKDIESLREESPLAELWYQLREHKRKVKKPIKDARESGDLPKQAGLRKFRDRDDYGFEVDETITAENAEKNLMDPDDFGKTEDPIYLSPDFKENLPMGEDGVMVWYLKDESCDCDGKIGEFLEVAKETHGLGDKTFQNLKADLEEAGLL